MRYKNLVQIFQALTFNFSKIKITSQFSIVISIAYLSNITDNSIFINQ